jgi:hypothetical protein
MNADVKAKWVAALRSGEYAQTRGYLHRARSGYCCLGVLCEIAVAEGVIEKGDYPYADDDEVHYGPEGEGSTTGLPDEVQVWAQIEGEDPLVRRPEYARVNEYLVGTGRGGETTLAALNDQGISFAQIADVIEEQL